MKTVNLPDLEVILVGTPPTLEASCCAAKNANDWEQMKRHDEYPYRLTTLWLETTTTIFKLLSGHWAKAVLRPSYRHWNTRENFRYFLRLWTSSCTHPNLLHSLGIYISTMNPLWAAKAEFIPICCHVQHSIVLPTSGYYHTFSCCIRPPLESRSHSSHKQKQFLLSQWIHLNTGLSTSFFRTKMSKERPPKTRSILQ